MTERVLIDTDPGIDDAMALLLALQSPEIHVIAVTTVSGNVPVETATRNVFRILSLLPDRNRPPVAKGASRPLENEAVYATFIHGEDGLGGLDRCRDEMGRPRYPAGQESLSGRSAADEILYQISDAKEPLTLIALGPLTNVARVIEKDRRTASRLRRIVLMGGAFFVSGNVTPAAEFNIFVDPHAARIVFAAGIPLTVVPLDVTRRVKLTRENLSGAVSEKPAPMNRFLLDATADAFAFMEERSTDVPLYLHDPLAVGVVIDPSLVSIRDLPVEIETTGEWTSGMTLADGRPIRPEFKKAPNASVCLGVDASRFESLFLERLQCRKSS
jgi:purine nucleosidase/pyrimidine-specific ribonucleoside hydrolase